MINLIKRWNIARKLDESRRPNGCNVPQQDWLSADTPDHQYLRDLHQIDRKLRREAPLSMADTPVRMRRSTINAIRQARFAESYRIRRALPWWQTTPARAFATAGLVLGLAFVTATMVSSNPNHHNSNNSASGKDHIESMQDRVATDDDHVFRSMNQPPLVPPTNSTRVANASDRFFSTFMLPMPSDMSEMAAEFNTSVDRFVRQFRENNPGSETTETATAEADQRP